MSAFEQLALKVHKESSYHLFAVARDSCPKTVTPFYDISPFLSGIFLRCIGRESVGKKGADRIQGRTFSYGWDEPYETRPYVTLDDR